MSPRVVPTATPELLQERLYARLVPDPETGCRLWTGKTDFGYGRIKICGQLRYVHCVAGAAPSLPILSLSPARRT